MLSGNCNASLGTMAGIGTDRLAIIWFDAHGEFNTPETTESGFLDGMGLAIATGQCWRKMAASIPNFSTIPAENVLHVGGRDFDADEKALLERCGGTIVEAEAIRRSSMAAALEPRLEALRARASSVYLHFDLDVLDPAFGPANAFPAPNGLTPAHLKEAIRMIGDRFTVRSVGIASYDPRADHSGEAFEAGLSVTEAVLAVQSARA